jgi:hypothetical protein
LIAKEKRSRNPTSTNGNRIVGVKRKSKGRFGCRGTPTKLTYNIGTITTSAATATAFSTIKASPRTTTSYY